MQHANLDANLEYEDDNENHIKQTCDRYRIRKC